MAQALSNSLFQNGILLAPIQLSINGLLYKYNKCNDNLHLLSISYSLIRGVVWRILLWVSDYIYKINIKFNRKSLILLVFSPFLIFILRNQTYSLLRGWVVYSRRICKKEKRITPLPLFN